MVRAAESIPSNIAEGCGATTRKEFARFLEISIKSCYELEYQLLLARDNGALSRNHWEQLTDQTVEVRRMLCGLRAKVRLAAAESSDCRGPSDTAPAANCEADDSRLGGVPTSAWSERVLSASLQPDPEPER
jgi:four helix bundle protein